MKNRKHSLKISHSYRWLIVRGLIVLIGLWLAGCSSHVEDGGVETRVVPPRVAGEVPVDSAEVEAPRAMTVASLRQSLSEFVENPEQVSAYRKAMETMRRNSSADPSTVEFRTSLLFWSNTHGFFGHGDNATSRKRTIKRRLPQCLRFFQNPEGSYRFSETKAKKICQQYYDAVSQEFAPDAFAKGIWGTCQHTPSCAKPNDTPECRAIRAAPRFLPWHRLYLYFYERTLRKHSGFEDFALPYWDYFDYPANGAADGDETKLWLPRLVTAGGSIAENTFFDQWRTLWLNERNINIGRNNARADKAFALRKFVDFSNVLEIYPHGLMHCAVGNGCTSPHMGWVPLAGSDPVFYMHHANIDRLWQCWMNREAGGAKVDLAWAKANLGMPESWFDIRFDFADENGHRVSRSIADAFSPEVMSVRYSQEVDCEIETDVAASGLDLMSFEKVDDSIAGSDLVLMSGKVDLPTKLYRVELLSEERFMKRGDVEALTLLESVGESSFGVWLVLENIRIDESPFYTYDIYISSKSQPGTRTLVTRFSFFGFGDHGGHGGHRAEDDNAGSVQLGTQRYYLNDEIHELGITDIEDIEVYFEPSDMVTGEPLNADGDGFMSIDSVRLITLPGPGHD